MTAEGSATRRSTTTPEAKPSPARRLVRIAPNLLAVILAALLVWWIATGWDRWTGSGARQWTNDAYLQSDLTPLSALVGAPVRRVLVDDYQLVKRGDLLVELDDRIYAAQVAQAEANVAGAKAAIVNLQAQMSLQRANVAVAEAAIGGVQATSRRNRLEAARQEQLLQTRIAGTEQRVEQAEAARISSGADVAQALARLEAARRQVAAQETQQAQLEASLKVSEAARDLARINLGYTRITAPLDGMVGQRRVFAGQYVGVGTQVIAVVPISSLYVLANFKETQLTRVQEGQAVALRIDTFSDRTLHGHVASWSPGTGAQFALLPPDNATGNFTKVVQRIPVKILLDDDAGLGTRMRPGMSVEATIDTESLPASAARAR